MPFKPSIFPNLKTVSFPLRSNLGNIVFLRKYEKSQFTERSIMGIWFEIKALVFLLPTNLKRMYLVIKKKNENSGS